MLTQKYLKELLHYDSKTGVFTWIASETRIKNKIGKRAGHLNGAGRRCIWIYFDCIFPMLRRLRLWHHRQSGIASCTGTPEKQ